MHRLVLLIGLWACVACEETPVGVPGATTDAAWLASKSWDDGAAVVSVYRGKVFRYGHWRKAEARDYVIREHFDKTELTKRDRPTALPVLKANRHVTFNTGTYDYRRMFSLFFDRRNAALVKAVGSSQDGCGLTFLRWDKNERRLTWDSYWEGEGRGSRELKKPRGEYFVDELCYLARAFKDGASILVRPSLARNRVGAASVKRLTVRRTGQIPQRAVVRLLAGDGDEWARFEYAGGALHKWRIADTEEFERLSRRRLYYWQKVAPDDERLLR